MSLDVIFNPVKNAFEKDCKKFVFKDKTNLDWKKEVKGKISGNTANTIEFFGELFKKEMPLTDNLFFVDENNNYFVIEKADTKPDKIHIKDKDEAYIISVATFYPIKLSFVRVY